MNSETNATSELESQANTTSQPSLKRKREGPFRGPSRALKYKKLRQVQPGKVKSKFALGEGAHIKDAMHILRGDNCAMRAELEFLKAESQKKEQEAQRKEEEAQRKEQAALKKQDETEKKLELIMHTLGL